jgi:hypothetical protein
LQHHGQDDVADDERNQHADEMTMQPHCRVGSNARERAQPRRQDDQDRKDAQRGYPQRGAELG